MRLAPLDVIRHEVVTRIVEAYGAYEEKRKQEKKKQEEQHGNHHQ